MAKQNNSEQHVSNRADYQQTYDSTLEEDDEELENIDRKMRASAAEAVSMKSSMVLSARRIYQ